jgi:hypothetical protein
VGEVVRWYQGHLKADGGMGSEDWLPGFHEIPLGRRGPLAAQRREHGVTGKRQRKLLTSSSGTLPLLPLDSDENRLHAPPG